MNRKVNIEPSLALLQLDTSNIATPELLDERVLDDRASRFGKTVIERDYQMPNGKKSSILLTSSGGRDPYIIFPVTEYSTIIMVWQFRFGTDKWKLELPGGCVKPGENWRHCAENELEEETGATAKSMELIGAPIAFNPALEGTYFHPVLAKGCRITKAQHLERSESIIVQEFSLKDFRHYLRICAFRDAKTVAIGYLALDHLGYL